MYSNINKKALVIILSCFLYLLVIAANTYAKDDFWAYNSETLDIDIKISSEIDLIKTESSGSLSNIDAELKFVPIDTERQKVSDIKINPASKIKDGSIKFQWSNPDLDSTLLYQVRATIKTQKGIKKVTSKIKFPLSDTDTKGYNDYLKFTENIDKSSETEKLAKMLAKDEDDLYVVVFKVSKWLKNNIEYNLSFSETLEKPSKTIIIKKGVCDEITALFVSMLRGLGIPAKYVSGYAYTDLRVPAGFGAHAWAEVYFPDIGWIPFDITYNEFGYVDASHIKLRESFDSGSYSSKYDWTGSGVKIQPRPLEFTAKVLTFGEKTAPDTKIRGEFGKNETGFNSYNYIIVEIENKKNYYLGQSIFIAPSNDMRIIGNKFKDILLKPYETKKLYWPVKLIGSLDKKYSYLMPDTIYLLDGRNVKINFTIEPSGKIYSFKEIDMLISFKQFELTKELSKEIDFNCSADSDIHVKKTFDVTCILENKGKKNLNDLAICADKMCKVVNLGVNQKTVQKIPCTFLNPGKQEVIVTVNSTEISKVVSFPVFVKQPSQLTITKIKYPKEVEFDSNFKIDFLIMKSTMSPANDVVVLVDHNKISRKWEFPKMTENRRFILDLIGEDLSNGVNTITLTVLQKGTTFNTTKNLNIILTNTTISQRLLIYADDFLNSKKKFGYIVPGIITALVIIFFILMIKRLKKQDSQHTEKTRDEEIRKIREIEIKDEETTKKIEESVSKVIEENEKLKGDGLE